MTPSHRVTVLGIAAACWASTALAGLLLYAIVRLTAVVIAGAAVPWDWRP